MEFYVNMHVNISLLHTNEVMNCRYLCLSPAEILSPGWCEIIDLCQLLLSLLGLEVSRTTAGSSELTVLFYGRRLLHLQSWVPVVIKASLFLLTFDLSGKEPWLCEVVIRFVFKVHVHISSTQERVVQALRGAELCAPHLALNFFRDAEITEWKPTKAGRSCSLQSWLHWGWCLQLLFRSFGSFSIGDFFEHRDGNRALRKKEGLGRPNILEITERNNRWMFVPKLVIFRWKVHKVRVCGSTERRWERR